MSRTFSCSVRSFDLHTFVSPRLCGHQELALKATFFASSTLRCFEKLTLRAVLTLEEPWISDVPTSGICCHFAGTTAPSLRIRLVAGTLESHSTCVVYDLQVFRPVQSKASRSYSVKTTNRVPSNTCHCCRILRFRHR